MGSVKGSSGPRRPLIANFSKIKFERLPELLHFSDTSFQVLRSAFDVILSENCEIFHFFIKFPKNHMTILNIKFHFFNTLY